MRTARAVHLISPSIELKDRLESIKAETQLVPQVFPLLYSHRNRVHVIPAKSREKKKEATDGGQISFETVSLSLPGRSTGMVKTSERKRKDERRCTQQTDRRRLVHKSLANIGRKTNNVIEPDELYHSRKKPSIV